MLLLKTAPFLLIYFILFYVVLVCFIFCNWLRNQRPRVRIPDRPPLQKRVTTLSVVALFCFGGSTVD